MKHHEQIDALTYMIEEYVEKAMKRLRDAVNNVNYADEERGDVLHDLSNEMTAAINRHVDEFDLNSYEIIGVLETIKQDIVMNQTVDVGVIGCLDAKKMEVVAEMDIEFIFDDDIEDLDEY